VDLFHFLPFINIHIISISNCNDVIYLRCEVISLKTLFGDSVANTVSISILYIENNILFFTAERNKKLMHINLRNKSK